MTRVKGDNVANEDNVDKVRITATVTYDDSASSPREDDNLGILAAWRHGIGSSREWIGDSEQITGTRHNGNNTHEHLRGVKCVGFVEVPRSSTDQYWAEGIVYVTRERMRAEYGDQWRDHISDALDVLAGEAAQYRAWADGCNFGVEITTERQCPCCQQWSEIAYDSVWGFTTGNPERDLPDWAGDHFDDDGKRALAAACEAWTGEYPTAATATIEAE